MYRMPFWTTGVFVTANLTTGVIVIVCVCYSLDKLLRLLQHHHTRGASEETQPY